MRTLPLLIIALFVTCSPATEKQTPALVQGPDALEGEYQIGDGTWTIVPVRMAYEMRNAPNAQPLLLFFQSVEADTISVYATEDRAVILKMNPGHSRGMYLEPDEQWEVVRVRLLETQPTESQEAEQLHAEAATDAAAAEETWPLYSGEYQLYTESEGAAGRLEMRYLANKQFDFTLTLDVPDVCGATVKGNFKMEQVDFGTYAGQECPLALTLKGSWNSGMTVQIEQTGSCVPLGDVCVFTGTYVTQTQ